VSVSTAVFEAERVRAVEPAARRCPTVGSDKNGVALSATSDGCLRNMVKRREIER
jgi:hypothetical protein